VETELQYNKKGVINMWLLKKFLHTDIIGKIYILIILFIVIVTIITVVVRTNKAKEQRSNNTTENQVQEVSSLSIEDENITDNLITEVADTNTAKEQLDKSNSSDQVIENNKSQEGTKQESKKEKTISSTTATTGQDSNTKKDNAQENPVQKTIPKETTTSAPTQESIPTEVKKEEKYIRNDTMIEKIKQVIKNNETEDMRTYGYNIVVDSSIKERTNQFTFTENRVINSIKYSFGTIRIYVEDYYSNGNLIMTECYIL
jgi:hypothetical protein